MTWFRNGVRLIPSARHQCTHSNHLATLKIRNVQPQDAGHYTLFAENAAGCIVSTAYLAVEPGPAQQQQVEMPFNRAAPNGVQQQQQQRTRPAPAQEPPYAKMARTTSQERAAAQPQEPMMEEQTTKALAPQFVRVPADQEVGEGKMVRFDCRVTGRPYPEVTWYLNGRQVSFFFLVPVTRF